MSDSSSHEEHVDCALNAGESYVLWIGLSDPNGANVQLADANGSTFEISSSSMFYFPLPSHWTPWL